MNIEQSPFWRESKEFREGFSQGFFARDDHIKHLKKLIIELADALNWPEGKTWRYKEDLVQRAREATR